MYSQNSPHWRSSAKGPGEKFPLNYALIRKVHSKNSWFLMQMCLDRNASLHATGLKRNFIFLSSNCVVCLVVFRAVWATMVAAMCGCCYSEVAPSDSESMVCCPWAGNETQNYQCLSLLTFFSLTFFFFFFPCLLSFGLHNIFQGIVISL